MHLNKQQFWRGISVLINNYHAINRKLFACSVIKVERIIKGLQHLVSNNNESSEVLKESVDKSLLTASLLDIIKNVNVSDNIEGFVIYFKCIPKKGDDSVNALGTLDFLNCSFRLTFEKDNLTDFEIKLKEELQISIHNEETGRDVDANLRWIEFVLKPKFLKWCQNDLEPRCGQENESSSLRLIDIEKYNSLYNKFKQKYSESALKLWHDAKESTDPLKFIYEDLAIAAYLISLWEGDLINQKPTGFADLGCGNGLLVYILIQEGYKGYGYDIRSRKLWSLYPTQVSSCLYEQAIEPFKFNLPSEVDWLIGNHSDELSPWLPVLAATCHKNINYFLLPCCAFEFSGNKFQRRNSSISGYKDFCDYAEQISKVCGFKTEKDRLKIPSTKRIALIGITQSYTENDYLFKIQHIKEFVRNEQQLHPNSTAEEIKLREKAEPVRNCTQIEKSIIEKLVKDIFFLLLEQDSINNSELELNSNKWKTGGRLTIAQIAKSLDKETLKQIKSECGGLKTLLRNKHEIFQFQQPDFVLIRKPQLQSPNTNKPQTVKKRACFFKLNHPQGCPLTNDECTFVH